MKKQQLSMISIKKVKKKIIMKKLNENFGQTKQ